MTYLDDEMRIDMYSEFGDFCARGSLAIEYIDQKVIPKFSNQEELIVDLKGVRNMNSSFCNAFFTSLFLVYGEPLKKNIKILNAPDKLRGMIRQAMHQGIKKYKGNASL
tara:strand:- start:292 stop:618 length:327 start_codon:yes stop_codon:yes gene_type:complete